MRLIKEYWWVLVFALVGSLFYFQYDKKEAIKIERKKVSIEKQEKLNKEALDRIHKHQANYQWMTKFSERGFSQKLMTKDLQTEWMSEAPIFFYGIITDISLETKDKYMVKVTKKGIDLLLFNTSLELNIVCEKNKVDELISSDKDLIRDFGLGNQLAIIAKIKSISTKKYMVKNDKDEDSSVEEIKIGHGDCVDLFSTMSHMPNFSFLKN